MLLDVLRIFRKIKKAALLLPTASYRRALRFGVAAAIEHKHVITPLEFATCVDVGANVGQFSLLVRAERAEANIIAFEPLRDPAFVYKKLFLGDQKIEFHQVALGPKYENADMHVSKCADSSSLLPISDLQAERFPGTEEAGRESVIVAPMSNFVKPEQLRSPALLKIDVQGYELEALRGCETLLYCFEWVYCECSFVSLYEGQALADEVISWLNERGFALCGIYNAFYDKMGVAVQADFMFRRIDATRER